MTRIGIENILYSPWKSPINVPLLIFLALLPSALLKILDQGSLIQISFVTKFVYRTCARRLGIGLGLDLGLLLL